VGSQDDAEPAELRLVHRPAAPEIAARAAALAAMSLLALAGCGSASKSHQELTWVAAPHLIRYPTLPRDRTALGKVRNASGKQLMLDSRQVKLLDAEGRPVAETVTARFLAGFAHGLYSPTQFGQVQNPFELQRLGVRLGAAPGQELPLAVAWRLKRGASPPARVQIGNSSLPLPTR